MDNSILNQERVIKRTQLSKITLPDPIQWVEHVKRVPLATIEEFNEAAELVEEWDEKKQKLVTNLYYEMPNGHRIHLWDYAEHSTGARMLGAHGNDMRALLTDNGFVWHEVRRLSHR